MPVGRSWRRVRVHFFGLGFLHSNESGSRTASGFDDRSPTSVHRCRSVPSCGYRAPAGRSSSLSMIAALFVSGRVLDLALAPGRDLGLVGPGVAHVNVEVVN